MASFPSTTTSARLIVTGGFNPGQLKAAEVYDVNGRWQPIPEIPVTANYHCIVPFNATTFLLIGGYLVSPGGLALSPLEALSFSL